MCVRAKSLQSSLTLWTVALQTPLSMGFSRQKYRNGFAMPSSRGSSHLRDQTRVSYISCIGRLVLYHQHHWEAPLKENNNRILFRSFCHFRTALCSLCGHTVIHYVILLVMGMRVVCSFSLSSEALNMLMHLVIQFTYTYVHLAIG